MRDRFEEHLTEHIRQTLDKHSPPYEIGAWEKFDRLRRQRGKKRMLIGFSVAASLLFAMALSVQQLHYFVEHSPLLPVDAASSTGEAAEPVGNPVQEWTAEENNNKLVRPSTQAPGRKLTAQVPIASEQAAERTASTEASDTQKRKRFLSVPSRGAGEPLFPSPFKPSWSTSLLGQQATAYRENRLIPVPSASGSFTSAEQQPGAPVSQFPLPEQQRSVPAGETNKTEQTADKGAKLVESIKWGVSVSPQYPISADIQPLLSLGGALHAEVPISRRFSIASGIMLVQQSLSLLPTMATMWESSQERQLESVQVQLTTLDVPLNIGYVLNRKEKYSLGISAGLSSLLPMAEKIQYQYQHTRREVTFIETNQGQVEEITILTSTRETDLIEDKEPGSFRPGSLVNLSIALERPFSKRLLLTLEPFVKYPLSRSSRENIPLGSGGLNVRMAWQKNSRGSHSR